MAASTLSPWPRCSTGRTSSDCSVNINISYRILSLGSQGETCEEILPATTTTLQYAEMCPNVQELRRHEAPVPPRQVSSGPCRSFFWVSEGIVLFLGLISVL